MRRARRKGGAPALSLAARLRARSEAVRRWFFPEAIELPEGLDRILGMIYPGLDLRRIRFHRGMPHVLRWIPNQAITLPSLARRGRVYVHPGAWRPGSVDGLGLAVHEAYHLLQLQESGTGLGLARPFIVLYLACAAANRFRYAGHPMEADAYRVAGGRGSRFEAAVDPALLPAAHLAGEPGCSCPDLAPLARCCAPAVTAASGVDFWRKLKASTPGFAPLASWACRRAAPRGTGPAARLVRAGSVLLAAPALAAAGLAAAAWLAVWSAAAVVLAVAEALVLGAGALAAGTLAGLAAVAGRFDPARHPASR